MAEPSSSPRPSRLQPVQAVLLLGFLLVLAAGLTGALLNPALLRSPQTTVGDGRWAAVYQEDFDRGLVWSAPARSLWSAIDLALFGQPPAGVLLGEGGWLFTVEEYATAADPETARRRWMEEVAEVRTALAEAGVQLLVALVPAKAASLPAPPAPLPAAVATRYERSLADLAELGVPVVDLRPALRDEEAWLRSDSHWTPQGATAAAQRIAEAASQLVPTMVADHRYVMEPLPPLPFRGDLDRLLGLGPFSAALAPEAELLRPQAVRTLSEPGSDLFTEVSIEVALVGTSYSADPSWSLAERLGWALSVDVLDASEIGRGPLSPMQDYLASEALRNAPPQLVVWELPERYLSDDGFLPGGADGGAQAPGLPW